MRWRPAISKDLRTATGQPQQFFDSSGNEVFFILLVKEGGDDQPRRIIGWGRTKAEAGKDIDEALARYGA